MLRSPHSSSSQIHEPSGKDGHRARSPVMRVGDVPNDPTTDAETISIEQASCQMPRFNVAYAENEDQDMLEADVEHALKHFGDEQCALSRSSCGTVVQAEELDASPSGHLRDIVRVELADQRKEQPGNRLANEDHRPKNDERQNLPINTAPFISTSPLHVDCEPRSAGSIDPGKEIDLNEVRPAAEYFDIDDNTSPSFAVKLRASTSDSWPNTKPWPLLECLDRVRWNGSIYQRGDIIYARTGSERDATHPFEIAEIRSLGDGRSVLRGFWYYFRPQTSCLLQKRSMRLWPRSHPYIKSTHTSVMMWDCASGHLSKGDLDLIAQGVTCDMATSVWKVKQCADKSVAWAQVEMSLCRTGDEAVVLL